MFDTKLETTIAKIGESYFVRIPSSMAKYFKIVIGATKANIEDLNEEEAKISFQSE